MTLPRRWCAAILAAVGCSLGVVRSARAEGRRVAAVSPDVELARALDVALSPWGASVEQVPIESGGPAVTMSVDEARSVARSSRADVVMWVSERRGRYAVWIYDLASNRARLRELDAGPPFDPTTAAAVALSVKALLRFTVVAPPPERLAPPPEDATWAFGIGTSVASHNGSELLFEPRTQVCASFWPAALDHRGGVFLAASAGFGVHVDSPTSQGGTFSASLSDFALRAALAARVPLRSWLALEGSAGLALHFVSLQATIHTQPLQEIAVHTTDWAFEPQIALSFAAIGGLVRIAPWLGATIMTRWQRFLVYGDTKLEVSPTTAELGVRVELALP
jgi:hypothetical protein